MPARTLLHMQGADAAESDVDLVAAHIARAEAFLQSDVGGGHLLQAKEQLDKALTADPQSKRARSMLHELRSRWLRHSREALPAARSGSAYQSRRAGADASELAMKHGKLPSVATIAASGTLLPHTRDPGTSGARTKQGPGMDNREADASHSRAHAAQPPNKRVAVQGKAGLLEFVGSDFDAYYEQWPVLITTGRMHADTRTHLDDVVDDGQGYVVNNNFLATGRTGFSPIRNVQQVTLDLRTCCCIRT